MPCACKKKGSGFLKGATWKGYGPYKKGSGVKGRRRRRKRKASGVSMGGSGVSFRGSGVAFTGNGVSMKISRHRGAGRKVIL